MSVSALPAASARRVAMWLGVTIVVFLVAAEVDSAWRVLRAPGTSPTGTARDAQTEILVYAVASAVVAALALSNMRRARAFAVLATAALAVGVLLATAIFGGQGLAIVAAILTMAAAWYAGVVLLRWIGAAQLGKQAVVAWLAGLGPLCLLTIFLGRLSLLKWWTMGVLVVLLGVLGCMDAGRALWTRRKVLGEEILGSSAGAISAGIIALTLGAAAIYAAAPEIEFDALYAKAYLPALWAHTGSIGPLTNHIQLNIAGWFQMVASWGNLLGAPATGRYLQLVALLGAAGVVWAWGRRFGPFGPLAAVAVVTTPALFWQATTAYDDLLLGIAAFGMTVAVFGALQPRFETSDRATGLALGLLAGTGASLKTHLIPLCGALVVGWALAPAPSRGRIRTVARRLAFALVGALITAGPPLVLRWIDTGNPVFPAYNNIFKSPYWLPVNEHLNFPFWQNAGTLGPVKAVWEALFHPALMVESSPPGSYSVLVGLLVIALLSGWRFRRRPSLLLWIAIVFATAAWWVEFRYLRYLLPEAFAALVLLLAALRPVGMNVVRERAAVGALLAVTVASFAVAVGVLANVPNSRLPISAAIGHWPTSDYLQAALPEREALLAFNRLAPRNARVVTDAFERNWLSGGRDLYAPWELDALMQIHAPAPTSGDAAYARALGMRVDWALLAQPTEAMNKDAPWLPALLRTHGELRFSAAGWDLYQFVSRPSASAPIAPCDRVARGVPSCWAVANASGGEMLTRTVAVCPGELVSVLLSQNSGGPPAQMLLHFVGAYRREALISGQTAPGSTQRVSGTVPSGVTQAQITVGPLPPHGLKSARLVRFGRGCAQGALPAA